MIKILRKDFLFIPDNVIAAVARSNISFVKRVDAKTKESYRINTGREINSIIVTTSDEYISTSLTPDEIKNILSDVVIDEVATAHDVALYI